MREKKHRKDKDRHEFAWNPDFGWQILRRAPAYRKAVDEFLSAAKRANDKIALEAYKNVSIDESNPKKKKFSRWDRFKTRKAQLRDQDHLVEFPRISKDKIEYGRKRSDRYIYVDTKTNHYRKFNRWYGDLILFPINPETVQPRIGYLTSLWALYSVKVINPDVIDQVGDFSDSLVQLNLNINTSFPTSIILDDFERLIRSHHHTKATLTEKPRWSDQRFNEYLKVYDFVESVGGRKNTTYKAIAEAAAPKSVWNKVNAERAAIDWAKDTWTYLNKKLIPIFERKSPNLRKLRDY